MQSKQEDPLCTLLVGEFSSDKPGLRSLFSNLGWRLLESKSRAEALKCIENGPVHVVLAENDHASWNWKHILEDLRSCEVQPQLVVTSRVADDHMWSEALNWGAYDVLLQEPLNYSEVERVIAAAKRQFDYRPKRCVSSVRRVAAQAS
jgi:response regulator RpfG family c-di-GMP phosphodiesterase